MLNTKKIADYYGIERQKAKTIEEMAELTKALLKHTGSKATLENIIEEIADVEVMLEQIKYLYRISDESVDEYKAYKIHRQNVRIAEEFALMTNKSADETQIGVVMNASGAI